MKKLTLKKGLSLLLMFVIAFSCIACDVSSESNLPDTNESQYTSEITSAAETATTESDTTLDSDTKEESSSWEGATSEQSSEETIEKSELTEVTTEESEPSEVITEESEPPEETTTSGSSDNETNNDLSVGNGIATPVDPTQLPAYSGTPYVIVNNNIPNFGSSELTVVGYESYSPLDALGRCGVAIASCGKEIMPADGEERGSISSIKPSGWVQAQYDGISGGYLWNRCHLLGWQLSAENANKQNLITGTRYMNVDGMLPFENMVADYIRETNNHVAFRVTPIFGGNNLVCSGVQLEAYSIEDQGEGIQFNVYCYNVQPGITIDYATGNSSGNTIQPDDNDTPIDDNTSGDNDEQDEQSEMVWIPSSGTKYHSKSTCSNMKNPTQVTKEEAEEKGYEPCKKCY